MPLTLPSVTLPQSTLLEDYVALHAENNISLRDAETLINYLNTLPNFAINVEIRATPRNGMTTVDAKWIKDNKGYDKPLNLYINGSVGLNSLDMDSVNSVVLAETYPIGPINVANLATAYLQPAGDYGIQSVFSMFGISTGDFNMWTYGWPEVQELIRKKLAGY